MADDMIDNNPISVVWYDGNQQCKVLNVLPIEHHRDDGEVSTCPIHGVDKVGYLHNSGNNIRICVPTADRISRGIDNVAFYANSDGDDELEENRPSCISLKDTPGCSSHQKRSSSSFSETMYTVSLRENKSSSSSKRPSRYCIRNTCNDGIDIDNVQGCSSVCPSAQGTSSSSHTSSAFEIQNEHSCEPDAKCSSIISCTCSSTPQTFTAEDVLQVRPVELASDVGTSMNNVGDKSKSKIHVIKRNMLRPNTEETIVVCNVCQNEIPITNNRNANVESEEPPPNYSSLRYMFLADEPPKYQDVTGKSLTSASIPVRHRIFSEATKRRIVIGCVLVFILLIGALLVYACFVSGQPLGNYGAVPRKF